MKVLTKEEFMRDLERLSKEIREGAVFIYPTDTIYGLGCSALNEKAVNKIRKLKNRQDNPLSVIAPSKEWIKENCEVDSLEFLEQLPGPYTFIAEIKKEKNIIVEQVNLGKETLGIRIPNHWISEVVSKLKIPIVTTSVNKAGEQFMTSLDDLNEEIKSRVDFIIYDGKKKARPSKIIDLTKGTEVER
jgi:tRNA threonylcarbamoyl adenosine modification protein (Sua5/YciO/YrdC/YwlC family)